MKRTALGWAAAALLLAFLVVLGVPREHRALALYAFLLLAGALVLAGLVALLAAVPAGADAPLVPPTPPGDRRPADLDTLEQDVRDALRDGTLADRLRAQLHRIAVSALARRHGVDLARDPQAAERLLGGGAALRLIGAPPRGRMRARLGDGELAAAVDELERV